MLKMITGTVNVEFTAEDIVEYNGLVRKQTPADCIDANDMSSDDRDEWCRCP